MSTDHGGGDQDLPMAHRLARALLAVLLLTALILGAVLLLTGDSGPSRRLLELLGLA